MEGPDIIGDLRVTGAKHLKINFLSNFAFRKKFFIFVVVIRRKEQSRCCTTSGGRILEMCVQDRYLVVCTFPEQLETIL